LVENPFFSPSDLEYQLPDFSRIENEHFLPAFEEGCRLQLEEIRNILEDAEVSFENTIVALEKSGQLLNRVLLVFYNKSSADTNDEIDSIEKEIAPRLSAHNDSIKLNPELFSKIQELYENLEDLKLDPESSYLVEKYWQDFVHAGAALDLSSREELKSINEKISVLEAQFGQNALAEANRLSVVVESEAELEGLSTTEINAAKQAANEAGLAGKFLLPMVNFTGHPLLENLSNRSLREQIMKNSLSKSLSGGDFDNQDIVIEITSLRLRRASILGFKNHAEYVLSQQTAGSPDRVHEMLRRIAPPALRNAQEEAAKLATLLEVDIPGSTFESWDWGFYTGKARKAQFDLDTAVLKPYFELNRVLFDGVFFAANRLFGLKFSERLDLKPYHEDARIFEVKDEDGVKIGLFIADFFARPSKRGGAWMNNLVDQSTLLNQLPVVVNNLNIPKPTDGEPALLTFDETNTLFHEFGHALHGLLSKVTYPRFSGTNVERDFVEFPSQVNEMWMLWPEVVSNYARHFKTDEMLPNIWIEAIEASRTFNEGFETTSYLAAAVIDLAWHEISSGERFEDIEEFEAKALSDYGLDFGPVPPRYRTTYFSHIFAGGYSAGYYGYIWSEVLDADSVEWFKENGGLTRANGEKFRRELLEKGGSIPSMKLFENFRGKAPSIEPLLKRRGLI
jgi:peptidyl-dipeptidase Dcp